LKNIKFTFEEEAVVVDVVVGGGVVVFEVGEVVTSQRFHLVPLH